MDKQHEDTAVEASSSGSAKASPAIEMIPMTSEDNETATSIAAAQAGTEARTTEYPALPALISITIALSLATFPVALDATILAAAIPTITDEFKSTDDISWYAGIYPLTICATQLTFGKFYAYYSIKWIYIISIIIFEVGSIICAAAPSSVAFIVGRAIAGVGNAGIVSGSFIIVGFAVPLEKQPIYMGVISSVFGIALLAGPLVGGAFSTYVTWRWCFWINLPIGAVAVVVLILLYKSPPRVLQGRISPWGKFLETDPLGSLILLGGVICLFLALTWGGFRYEWNSGVIIALLVVFCVCLLAFIADQYFNNTHATIPRRLIRQRTIAGACWFAFCGNGTAFILIYFVPIWFQSILGVSAQESGVYMLAAILPGLVASLLGGAFVTLVGWYNPVLILGSILSAAGAGCLTLWNINTPKSEWIGFQVLYGLGFGLVAMSSLVVVQTVLPPEDIPSGVSLIVFMQSLGGTLMIGIAQAVFFNKLLAGLTDILGSSTARTVIAQGATDYRNQIPETLLNQILVAFNNAIVDSWYVAVTVASLSIVGALACEWKSVKAAKRDVAAADES